ncbi:histidine kinase [bacterium AH-315-L15]|nr:histidine kinase [bacterium AH-315-L15]
MKFYRPKSVLSLVLIGFSMVALPLIFSLVYALINVDRLVDQSRQALFQAVQATNGSLMLTEQITSMERSARQFQILGDKTFLQMVEQTHQDLQNTAEKLSQLPMEKDQEEKIHLLIEKERKLFAHLRNSPPNASEEKTLATFAALSDLAQTILSENRQRVSQEIAGMKEKAGKTKRMLVWQAMGVIPMTVVLVVVFTALITNPIRQIDQAIRKLGDGSFSSKIVISGPSDLEYLGKRLDWLRSRYMELEQQKSQFLRHVSHELKTPLTATRAGVELLIDEVAGKLTQEQRKVVQILHQKGIQLQKMIENLINFSVVLERHSELYRKPVGLNHLIEKVVADHQLAMMARGIQTDLQLENHTISGDKDKLTVVVDNLISNAVKFSPVSGTIKISLIQKGNDAVLDVVDSGPGIYPEDKARIFDPFYQGRKIPKGNVEGTGIGLSLAKEYVMAHHGKIEIVDGAAKGAHLRVILPIPPVEVEVENEGVT